MDEKEHQPGFGSHPSHSDIDEEETATTHAGEEEGRESQTIAKEEEKLSSSSSTSPNFEPIRPGGGRPASRPASRRLSADTIDTLRRERSNNGWGCDDIEADAAGGSVAPYNHPSGGNAAGDAPNGGERDPFEVGWDGGDSDPLCPRSFPTWRKWLIIAITSVGSFCV